MLSLYAGNSISPFVHFSSIINPLCEEFFPCSQKQTLYFFSYFCRRQIEFQGMMVFIYLETYQRIPPIFFLQRLGWMKDISFVYLYWLSFSMRRRRRSCEIEKWFLVFAFLFQESLEGWWDDKYHQSFWWKSHHHWENGSSWWYAGNLQWKSFLLNYAFWICRSRWRRR